MFFVFVSWPVPVRWCCVHCVTEGHSRHSDEGSEVPGTGCVEVDRRPGLQLGK